MKHCSFAVLLILIGPLVLSLFHPSRPAAAPVEIAPGAVSDADQVTVKDLMKAFDQAEAAVQRADLEALMPFYAKAYNYHGLKVADVRRVWEEVFTHYRAISSRHMFTKFEQSQAKGGIRADVTCTGGLYGVDTESGKPITIDSWINESHHLVKEDGVWRFQGNAGGAGDSAPAGSAPHHPLF
jgi:hypothetical protein